MSILIRGMKMPTDKMKNIIILPDGPVIQFSGYGNPKPLGTAVPVPPHGRLIDADALCNRLMTVWDTADKEKKTLISAVMADIVTPIVLGTPTIIPASKEDE